jgi:hypothetical protein
MLSSNYIFHMHFIYLNFIKEDNLSYRIKKYFYLIFNFSFYFLQFLSLNFDKRDLLIS